MRFSDPFPVDMTAATFIDWLDKNVEYPDTSVAKLVTEAGRLQIATAQGGRELVDKLVAWKNKKDK